MDIHGATALVTGANRGIGRHLAERGAKVYATVDLLVDNAGIGGGALLGDLRAVRAALEVNFWGTLSMARAFAPVLAANGGGRDREHRLLGVLVRLPRQQRLRGLQSRCLEHEQRAAPGTGRPRRSVHLGAAGTDMMKDYDVPKTDPAEVVVDEFTQLAKASLSKDPREFGRQLEQLLNDQ